LVCPLKFRNALNILTTKLEGKRTHGSARYRCDERKMSPKNRRCKDVTNQMYPVDIIGKLPIQ
jgi:hypothetical protein